MGPRTGQGQQGRRPAVRSVAKDEQGQNEVVPVQWNCRLLDPPIRSRPLRRDERLLRCSRACSPPTCVAGDTMEINRLPTLSFMLLDGTVSPRASSLGA